MRNLNPWRVASHEELFVARYQRLLGWALHLTRNNRDLAEDLLHDAYIQFTLTRRDLSAIQDLDNYLYGILRHLHLSQVRRASRSRLQQLAIVEYDSAQLGLRTIDPAEQIQAQDELRRVCHYVCARKQTSKAGSILMLRFFHGYYPQEIAQIARISREVVEVRLSIARSEAKLSLENPKALSFMGENPFVEVFPTGFARTPDDFLLELRQMIFTSRRNPCLTRKQLQNLYRAEAAGGIDTATLGHIVGCAQCLDEVNRLLGLPLLSERYPMNTLGKDPGKRGGREGRGGGGAGVGEFLSRVRRRTRDTFEHRPKELHISINGFIQGSQKINAEVSELTLDIDSPEAINFVEVLSEQQVRLLLLDVTDPLPPAGPIEQKLETELSSGRKLSLSLKFTNPWPTLKAVYHDPLIATESAVRQKLLEDEGEDSGATTANQVESEEQLRDQANGPTNVSPRGSASVSPRHPLKRWLGVQAVRLQFDWTVLIKPGVVTALIALLALSALLLLRTRGPVAPLSASDLLQRSIAAEETNAARADQVIHRTIDFEERLVSGPRAAATAEASDLIAHRKIEIWQSAGRGIVARRLYDERGQLIAGDWRRADGVQTLFNHGARPKIQPAPDKRSSSGLSFDSAWQFELSAKDFSRLLETDKKSQVEERSNVYVVSASFSTESSASAAVRVLKASLTLSKSDLHPTEETILLQQGDEIREYRFVEAGYERQPPSNVPPTVFEPEPELLFSTKPTRSSNPETNLPAPDSRPLTSAPATPALEVEVLHLLNQVGADFGEQISVTHTPQGSLHVEGVVESDKRKREILAALAPVKTNPAVKIEVQTVEEALSRKQQNKPSSTPVEIDSGSAAANTIPADAELRSYFKRQGIPNAQIDEEERLFANRTLARSLSAIQHAWAIKRLTARFSEEQLRALDPQARANWLAMIRSHARAIKQEMAMLRQGLTPIFPAPDAGGVSDKINLDDGKALAMAAERLLDLCSSNDAVLRAALTLSSDTSRASGIKGATFWRALNDAESLATKLESLR